MGRKFNYFYCSQKNGENSISEEFQNIDITYLRNNDYVIDYLDKYSFDSVIYEFCLTQENLIDVVKEFVNKELTKDIKDSYEKSCFLKGMSEILGNFNSNYVIIAYY